MNIKVFVCGDIVITSNNAKIISNELNKIISSADISICNFEGPIESRGKPIPKVGPHVKQLKEAITILKNVGFNVFSLANNHIYDYGEMGLKKTLKEFNGNKIMYVGAGNKFEEAYKLKIKEIHGVKFGFLSACEAEFGSYINQEMHGGYAWINHPELRKNIIKSKNYIDVLFLLVHAGAEEVPLPLKEWRNLYRELCDLGVDIIIGSHPHVPQGYEKYNNSMIFYSLGNFYFDWGKYKKKSDYSYSVILEFRKKLISYRIITHKKVNDKLLLINENKFNDYLFQLNNHLQRDYSKLSDQQALWLYHNRYKNYYRNCNYILEDNISFIEKIKLIKKIIFYNNKVSINSKLLLLHNIRIESHRFVTQRALSLLYEKNEKNKYDDFLELKNQGKWT